MAEQDQGAREAAEAKLLERMSREVVYQADSGRTVTLNIFHVKRMFARYKKEKPPTDTECLLFMKLCEARALNPFDGEAWLVKYGDDPAATIVAAVVYDRRADGHPEYVGCKSGIWYQKSGGEPAQRVGAISFPGETILGGWAIAERQGRTPVEVHLTLGDFIQTKTGGTDATHFWKKMPGPMIVKVCEATAKRKLFPRLLGDTHIAEEIGPRTVGEGAGDQASIETGQPEVVDDPISHLKAEVTQKIEAADIKPEERDAYLSAVKQMQTESSLAALLSRFKDIRPKGDDPETIEAEVVDQQKDPTADPDGYPGGLFDDMEEGL